jgi:hypothetical protein
MRTSSAALLTCLLFADPTLQAQCSDAGACLAGHPAIPENRAALSFVAGRSGAPDDLEFTGLRLDLAFALGPSARLIAILPYTRVSGPLGRTQGAGDAVILVEYLGDAGRYRWAFQVGARLDTGDARRDPGLPQAYQTGLGPSDLILGVRAGRGPWNGGLALQAAGARSPNPATRLKRGDDLLAWTSREFRVEGWALTLKASAIQRLQESSVRASGPGTGRYVNLPGSDRLQVNLGLEASRTITRVLALTGRVEVPLLKRPVNVDGLKRQWTVGAGLAWSF